MVIRDFLKTHILQAVLMAVLGVGVFFGAVWMMQDALLQSEDGEIMYETRQVYGSGDDEQEIYYVAVTAGVSSAVREKVNAEIYKTMVELSCYGDPRAMGARDVLVQQYKEEAGFYFTEESVRNEKIRATEAMNFQELMRAMKRDFGYTHAEQAEVVYAQNDVLSIEVTSDVFCGGAHPSHAAYTINFDMRTGEVVSFEDLFQDFTVHAKEIRDRIFSEIAKQDDPELRADCGYLEHPDDFDAKFFQASLGEAGLRLLQVGYPYYMRPCEPVGIVVPYEMLKEYFARDGVIARIYAL